MLWQVLIKKSFRNGELIFVALMLIICLGVLLKSSFFLFPIFILFFRDKFYYLLWDDDNEREFYFQFENDSLKKILIVKQIICFLEFNLIFILTYFLVSILLKNSYNFNTFFFINFYIISNFIYGNFFFNYFQNIKKYKKVYWFLLSLLFNFLLMLVHFLLLIKLNLLSLLVIFFSLLFLNKYCINSVSNQLFKKNQND